MGTSSVAIKVDIEGFGPAEFEDGTSPEVIQATVKKLVNKAEPAKPDAPSAGQQFLRGIGLGTRNAIEGLGAIPGMAYDAARLPGYLATKGINAATGSNLPVAPLSGELLTRFGDTLGLPTPETEGERLRGDVIRNTAGIIPSMALGSVMKQGGPIAQRVGDALTTAPGAQVGGAAGAGLASGVTRELGGGPIAQTMAGLAGGVTGAALPTVAGMAGRGIASAVQPFTQAGREKIIGEALLRNSSDPETLAQRLLAGADDAERRLPGSPVTSGVASRDPQMMILESGLRNDAQSVPGALSPAAAIRDTEAQRNANRLAVGEALQRGGAGTATERGDVLRNTLGEARTAMGARTNQLFDIARDRNTSLVPSGNILDRAEGALSMFDPKRGGAGVPAELQGVLDDIHGLGTLNIDQAQNIRSRLGDIAGRAQVAGDNRLSSAAGAVSKAIEDEVSDPRWMAAVAQRRAVGEALGRDSAGAAATGAITRTDKFGAPMITSDEAIAKSIATPQNARQTLEAGYKALDDARRARLPTEHIEALSDSVKTMRQAMRDQFADTMTGKSSTTSTVADAAGNVSQQLSPASFTRWWDKNKGVADVLFDGAERKTLDRLAADFAETSVANTARARGSDTAQNLSVGNFIARLTGGVVDPQNPLAQSVVGLGPVARWITQAPEQAMREMLVHAIRDPRFAAQLVEKAGPQSLERAMTYWQQTMPERVRDLALGATTREVPRALLSTTPTERRLPAP